MEYLKEMKRVRNTIQMNNDNHLIRLNRFLAMAGIGSRRNCDTYILEGRVAVNDEPVQKLGTRVDANKDTVLFDGKPVELPQELIYILLNKPARDRKSVV